MKRIFSLLIFVYISISTIIAQRWKEERNTIIAGVGMTQFMGDLGGGSKDAAHFFGVRDINFDKTRPYISVKYRYRIIEEVAAKAGIGWGVIAGSDATSGSEGRRLRNLSFTSNIFEFDIQGEYYFIKEKANPRYSFSSLGGIRNLSAYVFTGVTFLYFNPKAELDGVKYALQPLGTEGQGIGDNPPLYSRFAIGLPIGIGAKYNLNRQFAIGIEISNTYTTSDYLDDAHDKYYDNGAIRDTYGTIAAELADRHLNPDGTPAAPYESGKTMRGNPDYNDAYILTVITLTYKIKRNMSGLPKF